MAKTNLKMTEVCALVGLKRWGIYGLMWSQDFPKPTKLNGRVQYWNEAEIIAWLASRKASNQ